MFRAGAAGLSLLASATAAGAIVGALWIGNREQTSGGLVFVSLGGSIVGAAAAIATIATENIWVAVPAIVVLGFCTSAAGISIQTFIQLASEKRMRGRVMGLYALIFRGAPALGAVAAGAISTQLGLRWPILLGALLVILVCAMTYLRKERLVATSAGAEAPKKPAGAG